MQPLRATIMQVLDVERKGGRLVARDADTLVLANMDFASQASLSLICDRHPHAEITMGNSSTSSSGYIILFSHRPQPRWYLSSAFMHLLMTSACVLSAAYLLFAR